MDSISVCTKCGDNKNLSVTSTQYYNGKKRTYYICRPCNAEKQRKFMATPKGLASANRSYHKYAREHPERLEAWRAASKLVLQPCEVCGITERIHRHHPDPAKKLEVIFLCPLHHKAAHTKP